LSHSIKVNFIENRGAPWNYQIGHGSTTIIFFVVTTLLVCLARKCLKDPFPRKF